MIAYVQKLNMDIEITLSNVSAIFQLYEVLDTKIRFITYVQTYSMAEQAIRVSRQNSTLKNLRTMVTKHCHNHLSQL